MKAGNLQRRWAEQKPATYDKETRLVCFDIVQENGNDENGNEVQGYSYYQVEIDRQIDYGHIKSQLIEAGYAQKDEFGLLMNAEFDIIEAAAASTSFEEFLTKMLTEDVQAFRAFSEFRQLCAEAAKEVMKHY